MNLQEIFLEKTMPRYDYECRNGHITEQAYDTINEAKQYIKCPECKLRAERIIAPANPILGLQTGTYKGEQHQNEVREAMKDFSKGKGNSGQ